MDAKELEKMSESLGAPPAPFRSSAALTDVMETTDLGRPSQKPPSTKALSGPISRQAARDLFARHRPDQAVSPEALSAGQKANAALLQTGEVKDLAGARAVGRPMVEYINEKTRGLTGKELRQARKQAAREVLSATRPLGAPENYTPAVRGDGQESLGMLAEASAFLPSDWLKKSGQSELLLENCSRQYGGGDYNHRTGRLSADAPSVALHEFVHRMQNLHPEIAAVEGELFREKTEGKKKMAAGGLGWYIGAFKNAYASRWDTAHDGQEIATTVAESIFYGDTQEWEDDDTVAAILGLFAGVGRQDVRHLLAPPPTAPPPKKSGFWSRLFGG
jgi:hypothetical protein